MTNTVHISVFVSCVFVHLEAGYHTYFYTPASFTYNLSAHILCGLCCPSTTEAAVLLAVPPEKAVQAGMGGRATQYPQ